MERQKTYYFRSSLDIYKIQFNGGQTFYQHRLTQYKRHGIIEPKENSAQLTPTQAKLLDSFDQLNEEGQTKVMDYAEDLCRTGYYKKCPASGLGAKEA